MKKLVLFIFAVAITAISAKTFAQSTGINPMIDSTHTYTVANHSGSTYTWTLEADANGGGTDLFGNGLADVLFGDYNPAGRLPITFPKSVGQLPIYYNQKPSAIHRYVSESQDPLYSFGYGLSYTTFKYSNLELSTSEIKPSESLTVSVDITNTGTRDGEEVAQLYIQDVYSSVTTPRMTLKGFERIFLSKGETKTITFTLGPDELGIWDKNMKFTVEPGDIKVMVGGNINETISATFKVK